MNTILKSLKLIKKITKITKNSWWSFHLEKEMFLESEIDLEKSYKAKDFFNLLRARTFTGKPSCWFSSKKNKYEVRIKIDKVKNWYKAIFFVLFVQ